MLSIITFNKGNAVYGVMKYVIKKIITTKLSK